MCIQFRPVDDHHLTKNQNKKQSRTQRVPEAPRSPRKLPPRVQPSSSRYVNIRMCQIERKKSVHRINLPVCFHYLIQKSIQSIKIKSKIHNFQTLNCANFDANIIEIRNEDYLNE